MHIKDRLFNLNLLLAFFFALSGYYVLLILVANLASNEISRMFTIPVRFLIVLALYLLYDRSRYKGTIHVAARFFLFFSILYLLRIGVEIFKQSSLYMSKESFLLYFLSFVFLPFFLTSRIKFSYLHYRSIFNTILLSSALLSMLTYLFYGHIIGQVGRITQEISRDENYISPLALSYCATLGISVGLSYLLTNKSTKRQFLLIFSVIIVCLIPFFLGASRGSIFAILFPFLLYFIFSIGIKTKLRFIGFGILFSIAIIYSTNFLGTGVFDRFTSISDNIDQGSSSAIRLQIWKEGINQFLDNPFFGGSLQSDFAHHHPHNIFIEVLISVGAIGFIPFLIFIWLVLRRIVLIIRFSPQYFWLTNIFIIGFMQNMVSGAIWGASWFAIGAALVIGFPLNVFRNNAK